MKQFLLFSKGYKAWEIGASLSLIQTGGGRVDRKVRGLGYLVTCSPDVAETLSLIEVIA
jgi:hypothetical protein